MNIFINHIEALVFCSPKPINISEMYRCLKEMFDSKISKENIEESLNIIERKFKNDDFSMELIYSGGGYQFLTKPTYQASVGMLLKQQSKRRLSNSALEALSIIAYRQPVTKNEIEQVRGVNCDYTVQRLLEKELIEITGKSDRIGRPLLYSTSKKFMDYFGINSLKELPTLKDILNESENEIGKAYE